MAEDWQAAIIDKTSRQTRRAFVSALAATGGSVLVSRGAEAGSLTRRHHHRHLFTPPPPEVQTLINAQNAFNGGQFSCRANVGVGYYLHPNVICFTVDGPNQKPYQGRDCVVQELRNAFGPSGRPNSALTF